MKSGFSIVFMFVLLAGTLKGQNCDTLTARKLFTESEVLLSKNVNQSYTQALKAFAMVKACPNTTVYYESVLALSKAYYQKDQSDSIIALLEPLVKQLPGNTPLIYRAGINHKLSSAYTMQTKSEKGLKYGFEALKNYEAIHDSTNSANMMVNIANVYQQQNNFKQADQYLRSAEKIASRLKRKTVLGNVYNTMGILYAEHGLLDSSLRFFLASTAIREQLDDITTLAWNYNNLGGLYVMLEKPKEAILYLEKALKKFEEAGNYEGQSSVANNLGELNMQTGDTKKALQYYSYSRKLYSLTNNPENLENLYNNLSVYYDKTGDLKKAFLYADSLIALKDSLYGKRLDKSIAEMQVKFDVEKKDLEIARNKAEIENERTKRNIVYMILAFFIIILGVVIWAFIQKRKSSKILQQKNTELNLANIEISHQREQLSEKQTEILDSIHYAKRIQDALLASEHFLNEHFPLHFVFFDPKDIVSGDFYWAAKTERAKYLACCDSTGHGVPGAFMSLLNIGFLSEAIKEKHIEEPGEIFNYVKQRLIETISNEQQKDGFDGILIRIGNDGTISYAAANNNPLLISNGVVIHGKTDKMPVGKGIQNEPFNTYTLNSNPGDTIYLYTDGYPDQFGGPKGKKFKYKQLEDLLLRISTSSMSEQKKILHSAFYEWKGQLEQIDDVCVIGIKL